MGAETAAPMDSEDLGRQKDRLEAEQKGTAVVLDQAKVESELAALLELAQQPGRRQEAIEGMLALEKQGRVAEDVTTTRKACSAVLEVGGRRQAAEGRGRAAPRFVVCEL